MEKSICRWVSVVDEEPPRNGHPFVFTDGKNMWIGRWLFGLDGEGGGFAYEWNNGKEWGFITWAPSLWKWLKWLKFCDEELEELTRENLELQERVGTSNADVHKALTKVLPKWGELSLKELAERVADTFAVVRDEHTWMTQALVKIAHPMEEGVAYGAQRLATLAVTRHVGAVENHVAALRQRDELALELQKATAESDRRHGVINLFRGVLIEALGPEHARRVQHDDKTLVQTFVDANDERDAEHASMKKALVEIAGAGHLDLKNVEAIVERAGAAVTKLVERCNSSEAELNELKEWHRSSYEHALRAAQTELADVRAILCDVVGQKPHSDITNVELASAVMKRDADLRRVAASTQRDIDAIKAVMSMPSSVPFKEVVEKVASARLARFESTGVIPADALMRDDAPPREPEPPARDPHATPESPRPVDYDRAFTAAREMAFASNRVISWLREHDRAEALNVLVAVRRYLAVVEHELGYADALDEGQPPAEPTTAIPDATSRALDKFSEGVTQMHERFAALAREYESLAAEWSRGLSAPKRPSERHGVAKAPDNALNLPAMAWVDIDEAHSPGKLELFLARDELDIVQVAWRYADIYVHPNVNAEHVGHATTWQFTPKKWLVVPGLDNRNALSFILGAVEKATPPDLRGDCVAAPGEPTR